MAIDRSSDSLSRCDPSLYSNIYDVRSRPGVKHEAAPIPMGPKDTIEISRTKIKEEALNRLRFTDKRVVAQSSFMRIGKYLFLAVAFPPYLLTYGLPRWVIVEALPAILSLTTWMLSKVKEKAKNQTDIIAEKVNQIREWMQQALRGFIQPIAGITTGFRQGLTYIRQRLVQFFNPIQEVLKFALVPPFVKLAEGSKRMQRKFSQMKEWLSERVQHMANRIQAGLQWIKQMPATVLGWGQTQFQQLSAIVVSWVPHWSARFETSHQMAQKITEGIFKLLQQGKEGVKVRFRPIQVFYQQFVQPKWQHLRTTMKRKWEQTRDFFQQKHQKAFAFLERKQEKLKKVSYQHLYDYLLSRAFIRKLPIRWQAWFKKCLVHPLVRTLCGGGIKLFATVSGAFLRVMSSGMQLISKAYSKISHSLHTLKGYVVLAGQKTSQGIHVGGYVIRKGILLGIYYSLLLTMMSGILMVWGMQFLSEQATHLSHKFSLKSIKEKV
jgi:hypothetical protein